MGCKTHSNRGEIKANKLGKFELAYTQMGDRVI